MTLSVLIPPIISGCITALVTGVTVYVSLSNRLAVTETKIDVLNKRVEKHNQVLERTYILERDCKTVFNTIGEMKDDIHTIEKEQKNCIRCSKNKE